MFTVTPTITVWMFKSFYCIVLEKICQNHSKNKVHFSSCSITHFKHSQFFSFIGWPVLSIDSYSQWPWLLLYAFLCHFYCIVLEKNNVNNVTASTQGHSSSFTWHLVFKHSYKYLLYRFARSFDWFLFRVILTITVLIVKCFYCIVLETIGLKLGPPELKNPICAPSIYSQPTGPFKSPEWVTKAEHQNTATGLTHNQKVESTVKINLHFDRQTFHIKFTLIQMICLHARAGLTGWFT